jgi:hypothetical protein
MRLRQAETAMKHFVAQLALIDPMLALRSAWHRSSPEAVVMTGSVGFTGWLASINWSAGLSFCCIAVPMIYGVVLQCRSQWKRNQLDDELYRLKAIAALSAPAQPATNATDAGAGP